MCSEEIKEIAKAIPKKGWKKLIDTACDNFSDLIAPITKTTAGLGGLIEAKFNSMVDVQKVFAADALNRAKEKIEKTNKKTNRIPKAKILLPSIEAASLETDDTLRDIWSNLIANEIIDATVHPEFPNILSRLSSNDAQVLADIAKNETNLTSHATRLIVQQFAQYTKVLNSYYGYKRDDNEGFSKEFLNKLGLIDKKDEVWRLTYFGEEFLNAVSDPSVVETNNA